LHDALPIVDRCQPLIIRVQLRSSLVIYFARRMEMHMKGKILFVAGLGLGYVLGTRAGREKYEQLKEQALKVWNDPRVQKQVDAVEDFVKDKAPEVADFVTDNAKKVADKVSSKVPAAKSASRSTSTRTSTGGSSAGSTSGSSSSGS